MSVELESGGNRYVHNISENSKKWLGESIVVKAANTPIFVGVVTNVQLHREGSDFGCIIVSGYSATYRLETAHSCFSWNDRTIGDVVKKLCEQAKVQLELNPEFKETKDFICQYEESDFDFIRRLAHQYQEWMYFDGTKLIFGKPRKLADPHLTLSNMAQSMTKSGEFMRSVLTINLIYNLKISKQSYAKGILLLILPMVRY